MKKIFLKQLFDIDIKNDLTPMENRHIRFTGYVNLCLICIISIPSICTIMTMTDYGIFSYGRYIILISISIYNLYLIKKQKYLQAKLQTAFSPFIVIFVYPIFTHTIKAGMFLWFHFGIMTFGIITFYVFSFKNERWYLNFSVLFFIIASIFYDLFLKGFTTPDIDISFIYDSKINYAHFLVSKVLIVLFLYATFYKMKYDFYKIQQLLMETNKKLDSVNEELKLTNANLETKVVERTRLLEIQNERIKNLAYTNSHIIRSHVARIIGLIYLYFETRINQEEKDFCLNKIKENSYKLNDVTKKLAQELITEEVLEEVELKKPEFLSRKIQVK